MHAQAFDFVRRAVQSFPPLLRVVEFGSLDVNGSVRPIFTDAAALGKYLGIDLRLSLGVDLMADWTPAEPFDAVVSCGVMEHTPRAEELCVSACRALRPGGIFILTCASAYFPVHGVDGGELPPGEFYRGIHAFDVRDWLNAAGFDLVMVEKPTLHDVCALAWKVR